MNLRKLIFIFSIFALTATSCSSDGASESNAYTRAADETPATTEAPVATEAPAETVVPDEDESAEQGARSEIITFLKSEFGLETEEFATCMVDEMHSLTGVSYVVLLEDLDKEEADYDDFAEEATYTCMDFLSPEEIEMLESASEEDAGPSLEISSDPDALGAILAVEEIDFADETIVGWLVTYRSRSVSGDPIQVTGTIVAPNSVATEPRPVLSVAHGTTGMADMCAPSLGYTGEDVELNALVQPLLDDGWVVVASDFEGMGGPGLHPYIVGASEAQGVFDIVRAAQTDSSLGAEGPLIVWGHSQGGHAAMHASQLWQDIAPELDLVGVAAGAPPSQFPLLKDFLMDGPFQGYLVMVAAAFAQAYDELSLEAIVEPEYLPLVEELELGCTGHIFEIFNPIPFEDLTSVDDIFADPAWNARLIENDTNQVPNQTPVVILHGDQDEQIPAISSQILLDQICALEGHDHIERILYEGHTHGSAVQAYWSDFLSWINDRIVGDPVDQEKGCSTVTVPNSE